MIGDRNKVDVEKVYRLKQQGLTQAQIAQRLSVTQGAIYHALRRQQEEMPMPLQPPPEQT
jgi:transcriptional regulator with XRE-family HTH domain